MNDLTKKQINRYKVYLEKNNAQEVAEVIQQRYNKSFFELSKKEAGSALTLLFSRFHPKPWLTQGIAQSRIWID